MSRISVKSIHKQCSYDDDCGLELEDNCMCISWDNAKISKTMQGERRYTLENAKKKNLLWIEEVKKRANWKAGEELFLSTKSHCDSCFFVWWERERSANFIDIVIEKSGYVSMRACNNYCWDENEEVKCSFFIRADSVYNDNICKQIKKKIEMNFTLQVKS